MLNVVSISMPTQAHAYFLLLKVKLKGRLVRATSSSPAFYLHAFAILNLVLLKMTRLQGIQNVKWTGIPCLVGNFLTDKELWTATFDLWVLNQQIHSYDRSIYFSKQAGNAFKVSGGRYENMLKESFRHQLKDTDLDELTLQRYGATCHTLVKRLMLLQEVFSKSLLPSRSAVTWPDSFRDLALRHFFR